MPLLVLPATEADAARALDIENKAYAGNPISPALFPGPPEDDASRIASMVEELHTVPAIRWMKVVDTDLAAKGEESMIAFSKWYIWEGESSLPPRKWGPGTNPEACEVFFGGMINKWQERFQGGPHVYLKLLHTDPKHQRRGAGSMLVKWGTEEADRLGLISYLEATDAGRPVYEKCGFREADKLIVDLSPWGGPSNSESALMVRQRGA